MKGEKTGKPKHQGKCIHIGPFQSTFSTFSSPLSSFTGVIGAVWTYSTYHEVVYVLNPRRSQTTLSKLLEVEGQRGGTTLQLPPSLLSLSLTPTSSLHSLSYSSCSCSLVALSHSVIKSFSLSFSICPWDTKMDGEAPGMGSTIDCATRWAASAAYGSVLPFLAPARLLTRLEYVCVKGGLNGTVWQQMLLFGQKSERGLGWGA